MFSKSKATRYLIFPAIVPTLNAADDTFISVSNRGITIGKLKMAINAKLLLVREAIAAIMVKADAKPKLPKSNELINNG